jgi:hypothetical protein
MGSAIRFLAITLSVVVAAGFITFAVDEMDRGSKTQQEALGEETGVRTDVVDPAPSAEDEKTREAQSGTLQEGIDDANDVLLKPFSDIVTSSSGWVTRGVPTVLALLIYGFGFGLLANFLPKTHRAEDWRVAT